MQSPFGDIEPPPPERPKVSAEQILWDELLMEREPATLRERAFDTILVVGSIAGAIAAVVASIYGLVQTFQ